MADVRPSLRPSLRLAVGLTVAVIALVDIDTLVETARAQARLRERVVGAVYQAALLARPRLGAILTAGGPSAWTEATQEVLSYSIASEAEVFDSSSGASLLARPRPSPIRHWPDPDQLKVVSSGNVLTLGPFVGEASRLLTYIPFSSGGRPVLLRLSTGVPDLVADLRERRRLLVGHGAALALLVLAGTLALLPIRSEPAPWTPGALHAYEEAMERLRQRGQELSREHEEERRRMGEEIRDKEALARAGELTTGIVHEVRNGLGTIIGYARMIERGAATEAGTATGRVPAEVGEAAGRIREECERLETVVRRFMDFVRTETLNPVPFAVGRMLARVTARESRVGLGGEVHLDGAADLGTLTGDEELLERAFENLVRNAREAAGDGGHVWIRGAREGRTVLVMIEDDGPGIPPRARKDLRPFFTTKAGGLGLGLAITLKIVRLHEGDLILGDRSPRGLAVTVRLPAERRTS